MSAAHTPGPWERRAGVIAKCNEFGPQRHIVALSWDDKQGEADARLIEAAPDMLEALESAEAHFGPFADITINGQHDPDDLRVVSLIRAAIAKARGAA